MGMITCQDGNRNLLGTRIKKNPDTGKNGWWDSKYVRVNRGEGDFGATNVKFQNVGVTTTATQNDINIAATGFGSNTALILDPRRYEFQDDSYNKMLWYDRNTKKYVQAESGVDIETPIMTTLEKAGYAVTYYSDAAVSLDKVNQMTNYKVSAINTHGITDPLEIDTPWFTWGDTSTGFVLSRSASNGASNSADYTKVYAKDIKYQNTNGMILIDGCSTFKYTNKPDLLHSGTLAAAVSKAKCSGGPASDWTVDYGRSYLVNFFTSMAKGKSANYIGHFHRRRNTGPDIFNLIGNFYL